MRHQIEQATALVEEWSQQYKQCEKGVSVRANVPPLASIFGQATQTLSVCQLAKRDGKLYFDLVFMVFSASRTTLHCENPHDVIKCTVPREFEHICKRLENVKEVRLRFVAASLTFRLLLTRSASQCACVVVCVCSTNCV